ncbi:MAG: tetratricopeptide repeat protein [Thermodesulfovibrionales bacterium]
MRLINNGILHNVAGREWIKLVMLHVWVLLCPVLGLGLASPAHGGLVDQLTQKDPAALEKRCLRGETPLCTSLGNMYRHGVEVTKDVDKAIELYGLACSRGDSKNCHILYQIGFDDLRGKGGKQNIPRAIKAFTAGCDGSPKGIYSGHACNELAHLHLEGRSVRKDIPRGIELLHRGCDRFSPRACRDLGDIFLDGAQVSKDVPAAVAAYSKACEGKDKDPKGCMQLGLLYSRGEQVKRDVSAAATYLAGGCTFPKQLGTACYELALLYDTELKDKKSEEEIYDLYRVACDRAESERMGRACVAAAERHLRGKGAKKDPNAVIHLYNAGCKLKDREACRLSCEWNCKEGQPHACKAVKTGNIPLGVTNCIKL